MQPSASMSPSRAIMILVVLLLAAHAPLFFNDSVFMDDWLVLKVGPEYPVDIDFLVHGAGHPVFFGYYSLANMTGTPGAYRPSGSTLGRGRRPRGTGDYQPWTPKS